MGLAANDIVSLTYLGEFNAQQIRYCLHYRVTTPGNSTSAEGDLRAMADFFNTTTNPLTNAIQMCHSSQGFFFHGVATQRVFPSRTINVISPGSIPGASNLPPMPPNVSIVMTKRTHTPGRAGIGSLHLSAVPIAWIIKGEVDGAQEEIFLTLATELAASQVITGISMSIEPGLYHRNNPTVPFSRLFDAQLQTTSRVMRRRTVHVGI